MQATVSSAISTIYAGSLASVYREGGTEYNIRVRGPKSMRRDRRVWMRARTSAASAMPSSSARS